MSRCRKCVLPCLRKTKKSTAGLQLNGCRGTTRVENPWWKLKRLLYGRRKAAKKFNEFVIKATDGLGIEQCPKQPSLFRRPGTTLIFECHHDDFYVSGSNVGLARVQENLGARLKLKPAEPIASGIAVQLLPCNENDGRCGHHPHCTT